MGVQRALNSLGFSLECSDPGAGAARLSLLGPRSPGAPWDAQMQGLGCKADPQDPRAARSRLQQEEEEG